MSSLCKPCCLLAWVSYRLHLMKLHMMWSRKMIYVSIISVRDNAYAHLRWDGNPLIFVELLKLRVRNLSRLRLFFSYWEACLWCDCTADSGAVAASADGQQADGAWGRLLSWAWHMGLLSPRGCVSPLPDSTLIYPGSTRRGSSLRGECASFAV